MPRKTNRITSDQEKHKESETPQMQGESSQSGHMPDPESDDDVLEDAQKVGLYNDADEEHPEEANIAGEVEKDEKEHLEED